MKLIRIAAWVVLLVAGTITVLLAVQRAASRTVPEAEVPGPVDVGFAQFMRSHHDQAVVMTQILLDHGSTKLVSLARSIQSAQLIEIGEMKGWLLLWHKPVLPATTAMDWMLLGKTPPDAALTRYLADCRTIGGMPGLATSDELNRLRGLDGDARDKLFLQLMIKHHQGGLPMAHFAAINAETEVVRILAAQIEVEQVQEMGVMAMMERAKS